jgi:polygalacturonase
MNARTIIAGVLAVALGLGAKCFAQANLPADFSPTRPSIPDRRFSVKDFGAVGDGKTFDTHAIQNAIDACAKAGGGTVDVPPGKYLVAPFVLASNLNFHIEAGATIRLSPKPSDYKTAGGQYQSAITLTDGHDIAITGDGAINGQGEIFWNNFAAAQFGDPDDYIDNPTAARRPRLIQLLRCKRVLVQGILLENSPMFHLVPIQCQDVIIDQIRIHAPSYSPNTDGIDPSGANYLIQGCTIDTGDDCIAFKAGDRFDPARPSCENILVQNCTFLHGHGMSIGSETNGGLRNMLVRNCTFTSTDAGIRIKSSRGRGGLVENLTYQNLTMRNVKNSILITSYYPRIPTRPDQDKTQAVSNRTPTVRHVRITDVTSTGGQITGQIVGLPEMPLDDIILTNVRISALRPMQIVHANNIRFIDSQISSATGAALIVDSEVEGLSTAATQGTKEP